MRDSHLDWIWSRYRTSPDAASGMQSLYRTCSVFTEHVLQPSHIILRGGGFALHPELAIPLTDIVTSMDRLLLFAAKHNKLPQAPCIGRQELSILTATEGLHSCATQNQIVFNWVLLIDRLALAMRELQWLCIGDDPTRHGWTSWMPGILASLPPSLRIKLPRDFLESYGITVLPPAANVSQKTAALRHAKVVSYRLPGRSHVSLGDFEAAVTARSPSSSSAVAKTTEDLAHLDRATSMSNLIDRFTRYPTPAISLRARTMCIVKSKSLSTVEITDRGIDSALGRYGLEIGFFRRVNDATNAMQSILTEASSLARVRDKCFVVDPHGALMRMLRGTNTTGELQAAWRSLSERMYISQGRLAEYEHYGEKAGNTPANECHDSAPQAPDPTRARSRLVPSNVTNIEVICRRGSRVESHESQAPAHVDGSAALPIVSGTVVEVGGQVPLPMHEHCEGESKPRTDVKVRPRHGMDSTVAPHETSICDPNGLRTPQSPKSSAPVLVDADTVELGEHDMEMMELRAKSSKAEAGGCKIARPVIRAPVPFVMDENAGRRRKLDKKLSNQQRGCALLPEVRTVDDASTYQGLGNPPVADTEGKREQDAPCALPQTTRALSDDAATPSPAPPSLKPPAPAFANADAVELGGLHVEMGETLARVSIVEREEREELHGRIAEPHATTGGRNFEQVSALDIPVADAKGRHILVPVLEGGGLDADTGENQQTKFSPEEQRTLATQPSIGQAHPVIFLYTSSRLHLALSHSFVVDSKAFALVSAIVHQ
ncbi:hypothetical protein C8R47DRAFT_1252216 [Mycena vitilis]|nr:hypothetical protein C8R47DRAFT_1252216 [Mycena vitilis]